MVQHPDSSQYIPWDLRPPEEPPGSPAVPKPLPDKASGASVLSITCKGWAKKPQRKAGFETKNYTMGSMLPEPTKSTLGVPGGGMCSGA